MPGTGGGGGVTSAEDSSAEDASARPDSGQGSRADSPAEGGTAWDDGLIARRVTEASAAEQAAVKEARGGGGGG
ncbi:hypothetical protein KMT30_35270, partial [Streptomyces sp. IBSBF 2953]|nr:hypothetical protein [Streptomyces hayashii]